MEVEYAYQEDRQRRRPHERERRRPLDEREEHYALNPQHDWQPHGNEENRLDPNQPLNFCIK